MPRKLGGSDLDVPICVLGDDAYALAPYLMKEFVGGGSNEKENYFGYRLSSARMVIENAYGILKGKLRILKSIIGIDYKFVPTLIYTCFTLHNFMQCNGEIVDPELLVAFERRRPQDAETEASTESDTNVSNRAQKDRAKRIRNAIMEYFSDP